MDGVVFSAAVLENVPLADAAWRTLCFAMDDRWLDDLGRERADAATSGNSSSVRWPISSPKPCCSTAAVAVKPSNAVGRPRR